MLYLTIHLSSPAKGAGRTLRTKRAAPLNSAVRRNMMMTKFTLIFVAFVLSFLATSISYENFIVPRLPTVQSVPVWWWLLCCVPVIAVGIYAGWKTKHLKSVFPLSLIGVVGYVTALQFTGQGFHDIDPGTSHHYMQLAASAATVFVAILFIVWLGWLSHVLLRVRSA